MFVVEGLQGLGSKVCEVLGSKVCEVQGSRFGNFGVGYWVDGSG